MRNIINNIKNNAVLYISGILAIASCFAVHPDKQYIDYINFRVLSILFCLMLIVAALGHAGTFDVLTNKLLSKVKSYRGKHKRHLPLPGTALCLHGSAKLCFRYVLCYVCLYI